MLLALALLVTLAALRVALFFATATLLFATLRGGGPLALGSEALLFALALALGLLLGELALALGGDLFRRGSELEAEQRADLVLGDALASALFLRLAAPVHEHAGEVVAEHDLDLLLSGALGDEADAERRVHDDLVDGELGLRRVPHRVVERIRVHPLEPLELLRAAALGGGEWLGVVVLAAPRRLVRMRVTTHGALDASDLVGVALENDVLGIRAALGAVAVGFPTVARALVAPEMALEDLIHSQNSGLPPRGSRKCCHVT